MMDGWAGFQTMGKVVMAVGAFLVLFGALLWLMGRLPGFPRPLPGDILIRRGNFVFFFPVVTSLLLSAFLTLLLYLISLLLRR